MSESNIQAAFLSAKIPDNSLIEVRGWVMLRKVPAGSYRVKHSIAFGSIPCYAFIKPRGRKTIIRHYISDVDCWINSVDFNGITLKDAPNKTDKND